MKRQRHISLLGALAICAVVLIIKKVLKLEAATEAKVAKEVEV